MTQRTSENAASIAALGEARQAWQRGDMAGAEAHCRKAIALDPTNAQAWLLLGMSLRSNDPASALDAFDRAMTLQPNNPDAAFHIGNLQRIRGNYAAAIVAYEKAIALAPRHPSVLNNMGLALQADGRSVEAERWFHKVLSIEPEHRQALGNLAHLLCGERRYAEAAVVCKRYVQRFADADATVWNDHGLCEHHFGNYSDAAASFRRALAIDPDDAVTWTNLGSTLIDCEDFEGADPVLSRAVTLDPRRAYSTVLLAFCRQQLCAWSDIASLHQTIDRLLDDGDVAVNAFATLSMPISGDVQLRIARRWAHDLAPLGAAPAPVLTPRAGASALRLGYVSSDLRTHPIAFLLAEVWERHDRNRVETYAYSIGPNDGSPLRTRIENAFHHFADCSQESVEATAKRIRDDGIDILIDLNGYTTHARSEILALRPAPLQMHWLGYLGSLGSPHIDYVITDRVAAPPDRQRLFDERLLYLPNCYCPSDTRREISPRVPTRTESGLPSDGFVFCCFNNAYKILPATFDLWMSLLKATPGSVLWLSPRDAPVANNLRREAVARGIDAHRLVFASRVPMAEHLARHALADLFLDTMPYNAGATANDALLTGLPVLTCAGETFSSRVAASQLHAIGMSDLVTADRDSYAALALALAHDRERLRAQRERLAANRATHPLFDMERFTRDLEDVLGRAWHAHVSGSSSP
jgi:protein O-GlcNAc transferase